jgi:hypothetical protein
MGGRVGVGEVDEISMGDSAGRAAISSFAMSGKGFVGLEGV